MTARFGKNKKAVRKKLEIGRRGGADGRKKSARTLAQTDTLPPPDPSPRTGTFKNTIIKIEIIIFVNIDNNKFLDYNKE